MSTPDVYSADFNKHSPVQDQPLMHFNSTIALNKYL